MVAVKFAVYALLLSLLVTRGFAHDAVEDAPKAAQSIEELRQQLEKILQETHTPGMSVAIVRRDGSEWFAGLGKADVGVDRAASQETLFRIGSTSKAFVSLSILKLVNEDKLSLQEPVHKLAPEVWFENPWEASDPVRVVDLLEHTTGWDDVHFRELAKDASGMGLREALDYDHHSRISRWRPGTRMAYCNSGPAVAAYIVEKTTGQRFEDYVTQNFFRPIGMKTATYFPPTSAVLTNLYHPDGKTPYPYWNILFRPSGSVNASANDMAAYLLFYLNRGAVGGTQVMPPASIDRMEVPTRTWAAQEGSNAGYGLGNYRSVHDGFVYHGHDGGVEGGLTDMAYMPDYGVGYFYSINAGNADAYWAIGKTLRAYVTRGLQRPSMPAVMAMPAFAGSYAGWYEAASPRVKITRFVERLVGIVRLRFDDGNLLLTSLRERDQTFLPVADMQFRKVPRKGFPDPVATVVLLKPNAEGQFMQMGGGTVMKHIPAGFAIAEIALAAWVILAMVSVLCYAPFWLLAGLSKKRRRPTERGVRAWPLVAVLSLAAAVVIVMVSSDDIISRMGNLTGWSVAFFVSMLVYALASVAGALAVWRAPKHAVRAYVRIYSVAVIVALLIATAYLVYWGIIGLRTWA
jgi:CubicO group peptidase (beta-lactamase class C family)